MLASWSIALFEYLLQMPVNRIGYQAVVTRPTENLAGGDHAGGVLHASVAAAGLSVGSFVYHSAIHFICRSS